MILLSAAAPTLVLMAIALSHLIYFRRNAARDSQQFIALADLSFRTARGAARFEECPTWVGANGQRLSGAFNSICGAGDVGGADPSLFDSGTMRLAAGLGGRLVLNTDTRLGSDRYLDTIICNGDLVIDGDCAFLSPVKVSGDLIVTGNAAFLKPLVVNGHTKISGLAAIYSGMVVKGELAVDGTMLVGGRAREGWLAASDLNVAGKVFLNGHIDAISPSREAASSDLERAPGNLWQAIGVACTGFLIANPVGAFFAWHLAGTACHADLTLLTCQYPGHSTTSSMAYPILAAAIFMTLLASRRFLRSHLAYPFVATMCVLGLLGIAYDGVIARQIVEEAKIINDTMNVLQFVMLASFILTMIILRRGHLPLMRVAAAVAISFAAKTIALVSFTGIQHAVAGATELLLLFMVYAFGAFSVHLMAISGLLKHVKLGELGAIARPRSVTAVQRAGPVDGLRGLAILMVVIYHYVPTKFFSFSLGKPINSILFVVAGFFFAALLHKHRAVLDGPRAERVKTLVTLLIRRHIRIWPVLTIVVGCYLALSLVDHGPLTQQIRTTWPYYIAYLGYLPRWAFEAQAFPAHLWVISAQETLIFALCVGFATVGLERVKTILWWLVAGGIAARLLGTIAFMPLHPSLALETPLAVLDPFALGMLARFGIEQRSMRSRLRRNVMLGLLAASGIWIFLPNWNMSYFTLAPLVSALATALVMILSADDVRGRRIGTAGLASPPLVFLGRISLTLFLLHPLVNTVLRLCFAAVSGVEMPWWLLFAVGPPLSVVAAWLLSQAIEGPLKDAATNYGRVPQRAAIPVVPPAASQPTTERSAIPAFRRYA